MVDELAYDTRVIAEATAGPWYRWETEDGNDQWITIVESEGPGDFPDGSPHSKGGETICSVGISSELEDQDRANAAFIARARTRYPELVAEVRALRRENGNLRADARYRVSTNSRPLQSVLSDEEGGQRGAGKGGFSYQIAPGDRR